MNTPIKDTLKCLDEQINDPKGPRSSYFLKAELLMAIDRQEEAIKVIEQLARVTNRRKITFYEASRFFFWRELYSSSLVFINIAMEEDFNDEMCRQHRVAVLAKIQRR